MARLCTGMDSIVYLLLSGSVFADKITKFIHLNKGGKYELKLRRLWPTTARSKSECSVRCSEQSVCAGHDYNLSMSVCMPTAWTCPDMGTDSYNNVMIKKVGTRIFNRYFHRSRTNCSLTLFKMLFFLFYNDRVLLCTCYLFK
jgi:hypothetical protein